MSSPWARVDRATQDNGTRLSVGEPFGVRESEGVDTSGTERMTFIVGAGASAAPPANLPLFAELRKCLVRSVGLEGEVTQGIADALTALAPETFMQAIFEGGLPLESWISETLGRGEPNAVHVVLAESLRLGATVWTVNVDELIEKAAGRSAVVAAWNDETPAEDARLLKPHGTVSRGHYLFRSNQVIKRLPTPWADRLARDCYHRHVILVGYAGLDIDLRVVLNTALADAEEITWFEIVDNWPGLLERMPNLAERSQPFVGGTNARDLSREFLEWAHDRGLSRSVTETQVSGVSEKSRHHVRDIEGNPSLARGLLLERIGERRAARGMYRRVTFLGGGSRRLAAHNLQTIDFYEGAWWTRPIISWSAGPMAGLMPGPLRRRADRVQVTRLSSHLGEHSAALLRAERVKYPDDPAILIARAKAARFTGQLSTAINAATHCETLVRGRDSIDELAHALFEEVFSYTWLGDLANARRVLGELYEGVDGLAGVRWVAWAHWQRACLAIYDNDALTALKDLDQSYSLFRSDALPAGQVASLTVRLTAARLAADASLYEEADSEIETFRGTTGWTSFTEASIGQERAEWLRNRGDLDAARRLNDRVIAVSTDDPIHLGLALLRRAEIQRSSDQDNAGTAQELRWLLDKCPMGYLDAHLGITEYLSGRLSAPEALRHVEGACPTLVTSNGLSAMSPLDYCLGSDREKHELFLP